MAKKIHNKKVKKTYSSKKKLEKLKYLIVVVNKGHGVAVNQLLLNNGASMTTVLYAEGTNERYVMDILGAEGKEKECILALVNEKYYGNIKELLDMRFTISQASKGILLAFDVTSFAGVFAYKFSADFEGAKKI